MSRRTVILAIAVLGVAAAAVVLLGAAGDDGAEAPPTTAPASVFLSPSGTDDAACTRADPCRTLQRAYAEAAPGEVVELAGGDYGEQEMKPVASKRSARARVFFRPARGAKVAVTKLTVDAGVRAIELRDMSFPRGWEVGPADDGAPAEDIVFRGTTGSIFSILNARDVSVLGGSYGPSVDNAATIKVYNPDSAGMPVDILVSGVRFHDYTRSSDDVHTECLQVYAGLRVTIRGNRFSRCDGTGALALTTVGASRLRDVRVENNWFDDKGDAFFAVQADGSVEDLLFRYNSATRSLAFTGCEAGCHPARVIANVMPWNNSMCAQGVSYAHNVLEGGRCGPTDTEVPSLGFADPAHFDLHLAGGSPARCAGDPAAAPETDIDGRRRTSGRRPDAGADEAPGECP